MTKPKSPNRGPKLGPKLGRPRIAPSMSLLSVKVSTKQLQALRRRARRDRTTVSVIIRDAVAALISD